MQTKIIITLLVIITLGIGYFVYQDVSEKRAAHKINQEFKGLMNMKKSNELDYKPSPSLFEEPIINNLEN